ncbi:MULTISPECIES: DUF5606 domain-containing protein [unclassified Mucilaginibacter]|uniref:DUF5606 family protein n=1 Tax=unclassified Mucilaginibacter TaxID=2617802 RepID=UPI002AC8ECD4|nr:MULTISPECIES: DUF5606 domain-containing protein [unclassified Mucilaginibacter]MEB0261313.1 DUF5606 domain-containing protein [Mucilaginibacter sp. 10I4]MEB0280424.1 DUF5606 domain-containing protein [Mucilaginibacter sp. 10B2]MEB0300466.1 DUF5606 domain-containing protein [Mucilaginibacter sp. 5C4]WPX23100.1 DUF5606 domain-containing protein [Mucilaginibacter sp. 5C4]
MNLQGIVAVSGKPGLWKALAQNKTGYVLESLDAQKTKLVVNLSTAKLAALNEITIFGLEGDIKLIDVFERMKTAASVPAVKDDGKKLREFFYEVAADHDDEKVYSSDIKKILSWFYILKDMPLFTEAPAAAPVAEEAPAAEPVKEEAPAAEAPKAKAKKAPAKKA